MSGVSAPWAVLLMRIAFYGGGLFVVYCIVRTVYDVIYKYDKRKEIMKLRQRIEELEKK